jgi:CheY-like chemotaxis protein
MQKNTVLIVDDDASNLMELTHILRDEYKIYAVKDGYAAIEKARESKPDLILLDIIMPDIDGYGVFAELKKFPETAQIPVIFVTGLDDNENKGLSLGAVDFIKKAFEPKVVKLRVSNQMKIINLQRRLETAVDVAESANRSKTAFLANMSHEIRTPMNAIMGITGILLANRALPADVTEALNRISSSSNMLLDTINDILDLTQIESGKMNINHVMYDVASMLNEVIKINIVQINKKPIEFDLCVDENVPVRLSGDVQRIKQILNNILSYAFRYTDEGCVMMSLSYEAQRIVFEIRINDVRCVMTPEKMNNLLENYSRFTPERGKSAIESTGLGLLVTKHLVNLMGGDITVEYTADRGFYFTVHLPQQTVDERVMGKEGAKNIYQYRRAGDDSYDDIYEQMPNVRVLIVDDVELNLYVAAGVMEPFGMEIDVATSGFEAIEKIEANHYYDVIFMDYMMPELNGVETTKRLRDSGYSAPIVALTADSISDSANIFINNGFDDYITKPINVSQVKQILMKYARK